MFILTIIKYRLEDNSRIKLSRGESTSTDFLATSKIPRSFLFISFGRVLDDFVESVTVAHPASLACFAYST